MKTKLKNIASVQMGFSFRSRLEPNLKGNVAVIQMKDLTRDNRLNSENLVMIDMDDLKDHHRMQLYDIAFRSRGLTSTAALIDVDQANAVIAAPLLIVRIQQKDKVNPAYLCWFINQPAAQATLRRQAVGSLVRMIGKSTLENLEIVIPPIKDQANFVALDHLISKEQRLMKDMVKSKRQLIEGMLMRFASDTH